MSKLPGIHGGPMGVSTPRASRPLPSVPRPMPHLAVLDGWRGLSILVVLAAHLLPLGPKDWHLNVETGVLGMVFFFNLSGFLITATLLHQPSVRVFLVRRLFRILPLLWLYLLVALPLTHAPWKAYAANFFCYANLPPFYLSGATGHLWSIGVEVQFYLFMAMIFAIAGKRSLYALPVVALLITAGRIWAHDPVSIVTIRRADDILAGAILLMLSEGMLGERVPRLLARTPFLLWLLLTVASCLEQSGPLQYLRPYLAMCLLGSVLFQQQGAPAGWFKTRWLVYVASISYAVYIIHVGLFNLPWFDDDHKALRLLKRPLGLGVVWALAHVSTKYYEAWWIGLGKRWSSNLLRTEAVPLERRCGPTGEGFTGTTQEPPAEPARVSAA